MIKDLYKFCLGAIAAIMAFACTSPQEGPSKNTLGVTPGGNLEFLAKDNEEVVLGIETDAASWDFNVSDEWISAVKKENTLIVNVSENTSGARAGRITITAGNAEPVKITVTQDKAEEVKPFLKVTPSDPITFQAEGGAATVLTVETNVADWSVSAPEWIQAIKEEGSISLSAYDNPTAQQRVGRITVSAEGAESVRINVIQEASDPQAVKVSLTDADGNDTGSLVIENLSLIDLPLTVKSDKALDKDVNMDLFYDEAYVTAYNLINGTSYQAYPKHLVTIPSDGAVTLKAGETSAQVTLQINPDDMNSLRNQVDYLIPVIVKPVAGSGVTAPSATSRVNYSITRKCKKEVKNVVYIDTKDTNPLNFLELRLEDGSMMVDAVVLFAGNINWDGMNQEVILNNNGCTQGLLDQTETYIQPLRKAGIKILLGLLGNHDGAGIANLSEFGAIEYSKTLANAVNKYKLDGISFDDEYSRYGELSGEWFENASSANASRLLYYTKKSMKEIVPWDTYTMVYYYGNINSSLPRFDGVAPGQYVDIAVADYPVGAASPMTGMTLKQCAGGSIEMNEGRGSSPGAAASIKSRGYGWMMWFSYNPVKKPDNVNALQTAAKGLYDGMKLMDPQYVYKKATMGTHNNDFDPNPYPFNFN